eukprot:TRINITY_DN8595_c0_g2_i1.p1 TRINITY_DN8595_c0_g2~~TRINITY_DN8595_c0_g2_i1.p1  ORF type:complete len:1190 (-),score=258.92 TRINITY_DN8595_c0_g2_i1:148-3717(-)
MEVSGCFGLEPGQYVHVWVCVGIVVGLMYLRRSIGENKARDVVKSLLRCSTKEDADRMFSFSEEAWLLADSLENGERSEKGFGVSLHPGGATRFNAEFQDPVQISAIAALLVVLQRRRHSAVSLGVVGGGQSVAKTLDIDLEGLTFTALMKAVDAGLKAEVTGATENAEITLTWTTTPQVRKEGQWTACRAGSGSLIVVGPSNEEELTFEKSLLGFLAHPELSVMELQLVPDNSLAAVRSWGAPAKDFNEYKDAGGNLRAIHQVVHERHAGTAAVAIQGDGFTIDFQTLHKRSAAVCKAIADERDAAKENAVVLCMGRGEAIGPTFLGILQSGCIVIPVDVNWPLDRIKQATEDANAGLILAERSSLHLVADVGVKALAVDAPFYSKYATNVQHLAPVKPVDPAVVLFTSGTTGKPKGIVLSHGYLTALVVGVAESKRMTSATKTLCYHSPTWMPFLDYLFCPLLVGGACLYFPENEKHLVIPSELNAFARRHGATSAGFVPAMVDIFSEEGWPATLSDCGVGGAPVPGDLCVKLLPMMPPAADGSSGILYTGYSGTEQGDVTQVKMRSPADVEASKHESGFMTAGRPHTAQRIAILDAGGKQVGIEAIGEVTVAGPGLASGYLNLPDKTKESFLPSCAALDGLAAVRSGDLAKWTTAGCLKPVGRRDSMVKVRGARIELGEVEGAVASHPAVKTAIVTVYEDQLVAYVQPAVPADLRQYCKDKLVAYMVPHIFQGIEEIPKLPNGKINKKALPNPEQRGDGAEVVMELDSLGQMRKFTRKAVAEDKILDNVRAILIGIVIHSHAIPLMNGSHMYTADFDRIEGQEWGPIQLFILKVVRSGGWSSLAFLSGFDDTRAMRPYGLTYREPLFIFLWLLLDFNWTMWYLPVFVFMRAVFCLMHAVGLEKVHLLLASQIWIIAPAFVDMYIGWHFRGQQFQPMKVDCPSQCYCPWQELPWAQTVAHYAAGWWVTDTDPQKNSMIGHALIFIPCYWIGFYSGGPIFKVLTKIADDTSFVRRLVIAGVAVILYALMYAGGEPIVHGFDDRCSSFWSEEGSFVWLQIVKNLMYYTLNLTMSLLYVVLIAALVPGHLQYLAKVCFASLIMSGLTSCVLDTPSQVVALREVLNSHVVGVVETVWVFFVPFAYELVVGAVITTLLPIIIKGCQRLLGAARLIGGSRDLAADGHGRVTSR